MKVRRYREADYEIFRDWMTERGAPAVPRTSLPPTGFLVEGACMGFLYFTDGDIALMDWVIPNPAAPLEEQGSAMDRVIERILSEAKDKGFNLVLVQAAQGLHDERFDRHGFFPAAAPTTTFVKKI